MNLVMCMGSDSGFVESKMRRTLESDAGAVPDPSQAAPKRPGSFLSCESDLHRSGSSSAGPSRQRRRYQRTGHRQRLQGAVLSD